MFKMLAINTIEIINSNWPCSYVRSILLICYEYLVLIQTYSLIVFFDRLIYNGLFYHRKIDSLKTCNLLPLEILLYRLCMKVSLVPAIYDNNIIVRNTHRSCWASRHWLEEWLVYRRLTPGLPRTILAERVGRAWGMVGLPQVYHAPELLGVSAGACGIHGYFKIVSVSPLHDCQSDYGWFHRISSYLII